MKQPESIKIDDVEYVRKDLVKDNASYTGDIKIVVLDRGFVYVGRVSQEVTSLTPRINEWFVLHQAQNIRIWGTSQGLGQLRDGPLSGTKLDNVGTVRIPQRAIISFIDVDQKAWKLF